MCKMRLLIFWWLSSRFCTRSLLHESLDSSLIDKIPGRQNDRKTLLGELNWIFTAVTDTIAWNVLPHGRSLSVLLSCVLSFISGSCLLIYLINSYFCDADLFQRLFRQDLLVASLFRNFLLAERIMRSANCSPISHPVLPPTHQHHMWYYRGSSLTLQLVSQFFFKFFLLCTPGMHGTWLLKFAFLSFHHWLRIQMQSSRCVFFRSLLLGVNLLPWIFIMFTGARQELLDRR